MKILEKLQNRLQQGKKDNKGFSLVELIIVIAIMAILIGIVGMNVIPQIENARKATDAEVLSALVTEAMEAWTMAEAASGSFDIAITNNSGTLSFSAAASGPNKNIEAKFAELAKVNDRVLKSDAGKTKIGTTITIHCDSEKGVYIGAVADDGTYTAPTGFEGYEFRSR